MTGEQRDPYKEWLARTSRAEEAEKAKAEAEANLATYREEVAEKEASFKAWFEDTGLAALTRRGGKLPSKNELAAFFRA